MSQMSQNNEAPTFSGIPCRGCYHRGPSGCMIVKILVEGSPILLEREPHNKYDKNTIKVIEPETNTFFGYIGREYAAEIAPWMDRGVFFSCHKTGLVGCQTIVKLIPIKGQEKAIDVEDVKMPEIPMDIPEHEEEYLI